MNNFNYKRYDIVDFKISSDISGIGEVVGVANIGVAVLGVSYIIRVIQTDGPVHIPNADYQYNTIVCPEIWMTLRS